MKKIKVYSNKELRGLKSWEYNPIDVENTYLVYPVDIVGTDVKDIKRVEKGIKLADIIEALQKKKII
ncbi:MAG: hypothetical protein HQ538_01755 [Parcubacteria group bacterium]|nr:hypothetical protein [Parcubacteria group bacterium]